MGELKVNHTTIDDRNFLAWLTLAMIGASLWLFQPYIHYLLVAAVLALATSHLFNAFNSILSGRRNQGFIHRHRDIISSLILTSLFLVMIFAPLLYFVSVAYDQVASFNIEQIKATLVEMVDQAMEYLDKIPVLKEPLDNIRKEGLSFLSGPALDASLDTAKGLVTGVSGLLGQIIWILLFYFLCNAYGRSILQYMAELLPMSYEHEKYLYRECTGTVAVVFYGTLFNMVAQGLAFGLLMVFVGDYNPMYLGALAGFCSVIPIIGAALVYIPVVALELFAGNILNGVIILAFAWIVMGFFIDNILRMFFIVFLKKLFGFEYTMNEILTLLAILAGISTIGFWGLIIGPSILALTLAAANLYSSGSIKKTVETTDP